MSQKLLNEAGSTAPVSSSGYTNPSIEVNMHFNVPIFWGIVIIFVGLGGFLFWAMTAPLDQGVVTPGTVNVDSKRKSIQHLRGGIVEQILVKEGDKVAKDQPLIRLNETQLLKTKLGLEDQIKGLRQLVQAKTAQIDLLNHELASLQKLFEQGYVPRSRLFDLERAQADLSGSRGDNLATIASASERLAAVQDDLDRSVIRSPSAGVVLGLNVHTVGGVINPSEKLMEIVPENEQLIIDVQILPQVIDKIHVGLQADIRFTALNQEKTPVVEGEVMNVSPDSIADPRTGLTFYTAKLRVSQANMSRLGDQKVQPGMPVDVIIKTGERTFMDYLLKPLLNRFARSLKEE